MNITLTLIAILQLFGSVTLGVIILYLTYRIVSAVVGRKYPIKEDNTAFAIFVGAVMFSVGYLVSSVIQPLLSTFRTLSVGVNDTVSVLLQFSKYLFLFVFISTIIALGVNLIGTYMFNLFTRDVKELEEISKNNVSVAIITGVIILIITLFARESVVLLLESIVPYPGGGEIYNP